MNFKKAISAVTALILAAGIPTIVFGDTSMKVSAKTNSGSFKFGDVNDDGIINISDVTMVAAYVAKKRELNARALCAADLNVDGIVDQKDITIISDHVKGKKSIDNKELSGKVFRRNNVKDLIESAINDTIAKDKNGKNDNIRKDAPYGVVVYEGEEYRIAEPALITDRKRKNAEIIGEPSFEFMPSVIEYKSVQFHKFRNNTLRYIAGYNLEITNDLHDATNPNVGGYIWNKKYGYLKNTESFRNEDFHSIASPGVVLFSNIIDMAKGCIGRNEVTFTFYKTTSGEPYEVTIVASSSDVEQMYNQYASPYSHYLSSSQGDTRFMWAVNENCKELYEYLTGREADDEYFYDLEVRCDERHENNGRFANLWIDKTGEVMATPLLFDNDYVRIVRIKRSVYNIFDSYETVYEIPLSDTIGLDQSFEDLYNNIKASK